MTRGGDGARGGVQPNSEGRQLSRDPSLSRADEERPWVRRAAVSGAFQPTPAQQEDERRVTFRAKVMDGGLELQEPEISSGYGEKILV